MGFMGLSTNGTQKNLVQKTRFVHIDYVRGLQVASISVPVEDSMVVAITVDSQSVYVHTPNRICVATLATIDNYFNRHIPLAILYSISSQMHLSMRPANFPQDSHQFLDFSPASMYRLQVAQKKPSASSHATQCHPLSGVSSFQLSYPRSVTIVFTSLFTTLILPRIV